MLARVLLSMAHAAVVGVLLAAIIVLDSSLAIKVLLAAFCTLIVLVLLQLQEQRDQMQRLYVVLRLIFVSVETRRLDQGNQLGAVELLSRDLRAEDGAKDIEKSLLAGSFAYRGVTLAYLFVSILTAIVAVVLWPQ